MIYLFDSNTFIEAKNRYYGMDICPGYWDWLLCSQSTSLIASIDMVGEELKRGNDELSNWAKSNTGLFLPISDKETQSQFSRVSQYIASQQSQMKAGALDDFLSGADPWLIAKALTMPDCVVVTHEQFNPEIRRKYSIPNVCQHFNVQWMDTFAVLKHTKAKFIL